MQTNLAKRGLSFLLALAMVFTMLPVQAFATEEEPLDHEHCDVCGQHDCICPPAEPEHVCEFLAGEVVEPTCGAAGYTVYTCGCGAVENRDEVPATGAHTYVDAVVGPTETEQGYTAHTCSVCGHSYQDNFVDALAPAHVHEYVAGTPVAATPEAQGYTLYTCSCGDSYKDNFVDYVAEKTEREIPLSWTDEMVEIQEMIDIALEDWLVYYGFEMPDQDKFADLVRAQLYEEEIPAELEAEWKTIRAQIEDVVVNKMTDNERENATTPIKEVEYLLNLYTEENMLSEKQLEALAVFNPVFWDFAELVYEYGTEPTHLVSGTLTDAKIGLSNSNGTWSASGTKITGSVQGGSLFGQYFAEDTTLTITNNRSYPITLYFDYSIYFRESGESYLHINGTQVQKSSKEGQTLTGNSGDITIAAGGSIPVKVTAGKRSGDNKTELTITNIVAKATVAFNSADNGTYTVTGGNLSGAAAPTSDTAACTTSYTVTATPAEGGYKLTGWYNGDTLLSTSNPYTFTMDDTRSITPRFEIPVYKTTFKAPVGTGSYTVNGTAWTEEFSDTDASFNLVASHAIAQKFLGWYDGNDTLLSSSLTFDYVVTGDGSVYPKFEDLPTYDINVEYDTNGGTITGAGADAGAEGVQSTLTATANSGWTFLGWTDTSGKILSTANSYTVTPTADVNLKAAFAHSTAAAWFRVGSNAAGSYLFNDLTAAGTYASSASSKTVILAADGTLPAGDYTIPSGVTLLIPRSTDENVHTTPPLANEGGLLGGYDIKQTYVTPSAFRTLHMASGANITVAGTINVAGAQYAGGRPVGGVHGPVGFIKMDSGSKITVNSGAKLYAWGYVMGSGEVEILSGGTVYECFQVMDWRGGNATTQFMDNDKKVFPLSQYYIQNIEVPMKLNAGAVEQAYTSTTASQRTVGVDVPLVGTNSMFTINSGCLIKDYDEKTDRQIYKVDGNVSMKNIRIEMPVVGTMDSSSYVLPITNNLTVEVASGIIEITEDLAFLPGAEIIVRQGAVCNLADGKNVYVYDYDEWATANNAAGKGFVSHEGYEFIALWYVPGRTGTRTGLTDATIQIDGTINADAGFLYTTTSGAKVFSTGTGVVKMKSGTATVTYQATQDSGNTPQYWEVPVQVAKLQNADGTTTNPDKINPDLGVVYTYTNGVWVADCPGDGTCIFPDDQPACKAKECIYCDYVDASNLAAHTPGAAATCETDQTCTVCGVVLEEKLGHDEKTLNAVPATCYATGLTEGKVCQREGCGVTLVEQTVTDMIGHTWGTTPVSSVAPTCTEAGSQTFKCTVCQGAFHDGKIEETAIGTDVRTVDATGHQNVTAFEKKPATCTAPGLQAYWYCSGCKVYFSDADYTKKIEDLTAWKSSGGEGYIAALGHQNITEHAEVPAKCDAYGTKAYYTCGVCGKNYTTKVSDTQLSGEIADLSSWQNTEDQGKIAKLPHTEKNVDKVDATCLAPGKEAGVECGVCGALISGCDEIPVKDHKGIEVNGQAATCTEPGWKDYYQCQSGCGKFYTTKGEDDVLSGEIKDLEAWKSASDGGLIKALGHHLVLVPEVAKTCTTQGTAAHYKCVADEACTENDCDGRTVYCGKLFKDEKGTESVTADDLIIEAGHTPAEAVIENMDETTGIYESVVYCAVEGCMTDGKRTVISRVTIIPGQSAEHTLEMLDRVEATCYSTGLTAGAKCTVGIEGGCAACIKDEKDFIQEQQEIEMLPHTVIPSEVKIEWNSDYTQCTATATCTVCAQAVADGKIEQAAVVTETVVATETARTDATCEEAGSVTYTSKAFTNEAFTNANIGAQTKNVTIPKLNHDWSGTVEYTELEGAETCTATLKCKNNESHVQTETVEVTATTMGATCTEAGYTTYKANFTQSWTEDQSKTVQGDAAKGHTYKINGNTLVWSNDHTSCTADLQCTVCDLPEYEQKNVEASVSVKTIKNATCEEAGEILYTATFAVPDGVRGTMTTTEEPIRTETVYPDALNHDWDYTYEWSDDNSTCTATRVCKNDSKHTDTETVESASTGGATCTNAGTITYTATFEGFEVQTKQVKQDALGHDPVKVEATASTCEEKGVQGNNEYYTCSRCTDVFADSACTVSTTVAQQTLPFVEHKYTTYTYDGNATCEKDGTMTAACEYGCGTEDEKADPAHKQTGHNYDAGVIKEGDEPTCTEIGTKTFTCQNTWCDTEGGDSYTETVDALGHELVKIDGVESTCDIAGYNAYYQCAPKTRSGERTYHCGNYFATEKDTAADAKSIATNETELTAWQTKSVEEGGGALALRECKDEDFDHECDYDDCNKEIGKHEDADQDHKCDTYGESCALGAIGEHADKDNDQGHKCDYCGEKMGDHVFTNGVCTCNYVQDLTVNITIKAEGQVDQNLEEETIKYQNSGNDFTKTLDLSKFGKCYAIQDMSATVDGAAVEYETQDNSLTIKSDYLTGNVEIIVTADQNHKTDAAHTNVTTKEPTCTDPGEKKTVLTCKNCGTEYDTLTEVLPAKEHAWVESYVDPTFDADGYTLFHCENDSKHDYTVIDKGTKLIAVAEFNGTKYQKLEDAIAAATARQRGELTLLAKVTVEGSQVWDLGKVQLYTANAGYENYSVIVKGDLTIKSGTYNIESVYGIGVQSSGKLTIDGGTFEVIGDNDYLIGSWGTTEINGGEFVGQYNCVNGFAGSLIINGGEFETAALDSTGEWPSEDVLAEDGVAQVKGGTFSKSVADYVAEGYCQVEDKNGFEVDAHEPRESFKENEVPATCDTDGSYDLVTMCDRCEAEISRVNTVDPATGHTVEVTEGKAADCQNPGYKEAYYCSICEKYFATRVSEKELADEITVALEEWQKDGGKIDPLAHRTYAISATPAGCEKTGNNKYYKCLDCKNAFEDEAGLKPTTDAEQVVPALGHDHNWKGGKVVTPPTCVDKGYTTYKCSRCDNDPDGDYVGDYVDAQGHDYNWDGGKIVTDPTCEEQGYTTYVCSRGDETHVGDKVAATGHQNVVDVPGQNAVCGVAGWKVSYKCEDCGVYFENKACSVKIGDEAAWIEWKTNGNGKIDALVHNIVDVSGKAPECEIAGYEASYQCDSCKLYFSDKENQTLIGDGSQAAYDAWIAESGAGYLKPTGHTDGEVKTENVVPPQCEIDGSHDEVTYCAVCKNPIKTNHVVDDKTGHTAEEIKAAVAPTCTATGLTEGKYCSACDKWTVPQEVVKANGHTAVIDEAVEATCTATGLTEGSHCANCPAVLKAQTVVGMKAHTHNVLVETNNASCTVDGSQIWKCQDCTDTKTVVLKATGHNSDGVLEAKAPTCTATGLTAGKECSVCGYDTEPQEIVDATGHLDVSVVKQVDPDCENNGVKEYYHCNDCNVDYATKISETEYTDAIINLNYWKANDGKIDKLGHKNEVIPAVAPSCTVDGLKAGVKCSVCGDILTKQEVDPAKGHNEVTDKAVAPTCTETGLTEGKHCSRCDWKLPQEVVLATGHLNVTVIEKVDPDCTTDGVKEYYHCEDCGKYYATKTSETELADEITDLTAWKATSGKIDKLGHKEEEIPAEAPDCVNTGLTVGKKCTVCGATTVKQDTVPALGHKEVIDGKVDPTCTETGLTEGKHCSVCNEVLVKQEVVGAKGHKGFVVKGQAAKCEQDGWKDYYQCNGCKLFFQDLECTQPIADVDAWKIAEDGGKIAQLGHSWDDGRVTTLPTCTEDGVKTFTCGNCNGTKTEAEPMLGHETEAHDAQHPTYYSAGWEAYETCTRCDYSTFKAIDPLGEPSVGTFEEFMTSLKLLEEYANAYAKANPGKDPLWLLIKYVRTGVDRYNSGSWNIMAGYEDEGFAEYVMKQEEAYNKAAPTVDDMINVTGIKNIKNFKIPNGQGVDFGHMFGTMDITYHNKNSINHADVSGWAGDLVDLLSTADRHDVTGTVDEMIKEIGETYLNHSIEGESDQFSQTDMYGDLDGYYFMNELIGQDYESGMLYSMMERYFVSGLTDEQRADYFLKNRLGGVTGKNEIRDAVFSEYTGNSVIATLEGTREFKQADVSDMRKACCYAFADYLCKLAGDYVVENENRHLSVFSSETSTLAPGITQQISKATTTDGKQVVYYTATADVTSPYVHVYANYKDNDPSLGWGMQRVRDQANAAQAKYGDPDSDLYIPNYNVIAAVNGAGYNMTTGEPGGVLMMGGVEYHAPNGGGFFGIKKDGTACLGSDEDYYDLKAKGELSEAIAIFGSTLVKDGKINISSNDYSRASRTAIGYTKTGKVVTMVMDGRQEPISCGGSMAEIAQVMLDAGCIYAVNLDGGGSTTYVARQEGEEELSLVSSPSDGFERSVSTSWLIVSTAPSSTAFDHAVLNSDVRHMTIGSTVQVTATGASATGSPAELPEGTTWTVSDTKVASIDQNGVVTALANGKFDVQLKLGDEVIGSRTLNVVVPDAVYFTKENMNAVYGEPATLPVAALYEGKPVAITEADVTFSLSNDAAGTTEGFTFTGIEASGIKTVKVNAHAVNNPDATSGAININLFKAGEASFDFENADGGDRLLAWKRVVSNSTTVDSVTYTVVDKEKPMVTEYTFGMDMTQIPIPEELNDLIYMLPGADVEGNNSAWSFLLQLAERVSVLTEVKATLKLDPNFDVDYSKMSVVCEYFTLESTTLNAETNELILSLRWKDQTKAIDPDTANPMVILAGIKLTPKADAAWNAKDQLSVVNSGNISYDIYLRANALYSFASKPENQEAYKLYPFVNPDVIIGGAAESGGHFSDVYKEFNDEYTLNKGAKNGWVYEDGGYAYYEDGEKYIGIQKVGQFYYDFGTNGINVGQTKFTGMFQINGVNHYAKEGLLTGGWHIDGEDKYYFDANGKAVDGEIVLDEVNMIFDNGLHVGGYSGFLKKSDGNTYYYQNGSMYYGWLELGDEWYHFNTESGIMTVGDGTAATKLFPDDEAKAKGAYYVFDAEGHALYGFPNNYGYYYWAGQPIRDKWVRNGYDLDGWYHTNDTGHFVTSGGSESYKLELDGVTYDAVKIAFDGVVYVFNDKNGKLLLGSMVLEDGFWYYYWAGEPVNDGWFEFEGETYYAYEDGKLASGAQTIDGKSYMFTERGILIKEGTTLNVIMSNDLTKMTLKVNNVKDVERVMLAMWSDVNGQDDLEWFEATNDGEGIWTIEIDPLCQQYKDIGRYQIHAYEYSEDGTMGDLLVATIYDLAKIGHKTGEPVKQNVVAPTCTSAGGYDLVTICEACNETVDTKHVVEPAVGNKHVYDDNVDGTCNVCGVDRATVEKRQVVHMLRMYNPYSGEHFYTGSEEEKDNLVAAGWHYEGVAFTFPANTGAPVYRLYDPVTGEHLYTMDEEEKATLEAAGWNYEGIAFNSAYDTEAVQHRLHNPYATVGAYHFTFSEEEMQNLINAGWEYQGIGWYSCWK